MSVFKFGLLVLAILHFFHSKVDSASTSALRETTNRNRDFEDAESSDLEYRFFHSTKIFKVLEKLVNKFMEKFVYDHERSQKKQTVPDIPEVSTSPTASTVTTEVSNIETKLKDTTTPITSTTEHFTEKSVTYSTSENKNNQNKKSEPNATKVARTTESTDDMINLKQNNEVNDAKTSVINEYTRNNEVDDTSVINENKEVNSNSNSLTEVDKTKSLVNKIGEHTDQQNNQQIPILDDSLNRPHGTVGHKPHSYAEIHPNNNMLIMSLQDPAAKAVISKNSLHRLFMLMKILNGNSNVSMLNLTLQYFYLL